VQYAIDRWGAVRASHREIGSNRAMTEPTQSSRGERSTPVTLSVSPISAGRVLDERFEIVGVLGEGGTGIVYDAVRLGEQTGEERARTPVALKVIHSHLLMDKQIRGRFTREANILRRLQGENLCPILDYGEVVDPHHQEQRLLFIALPKIDGPPLDQVLREKAPLPITRVTEIATQVCSALASAHAQGVIHRDLKPANVLLEKGERAVVVDFGMAKIVTGAGTETTALTQQNMVFGTPEYMAPEQARGDELDARCDVYAVGVILYEMLCGKVPFSGVSPLAVLTAHLTQPPTPPRERAKDRDIPAALEAVVMHALAKDPAERYPTALALKVAIGRAADYPEDVDGVQPSNDVSATPAPVVIAEKELEELAHANTMPTPEPTPPTSARRPTPTSIAPNSAPRSEKPKPSQAYKLVWIAAVVIGLGLGVWLSLKFG
jgi:serine/threonine protein kinase